jgi:hypothetical protein
MCWDLSTSLSHCNALQGHGTRIGNFRQSLKVQGRQNPMWGALLVALVLVALLLPLRLLLHLDYLSYLLFVD